MKKTGDEAVVRLRAPSELDHLVSEFRGTSTGDLKVRNWTVKADDRSDDQGVLLAMKKSNKGTLLTFKTEVYWEPQFDCKDTPFINFIDPAGRVHYKQKCKELAPEKKLLKQDPTVVPSDEAEFMKPGQLVRLVSRFGADRQSRLGFPVEILAPAKNKGAEGALLRYYLIEISH
jgi:hypothetical protein